MKAEQVQISAPNFKTAVFEIVGTAPLVINRFSQKAKGTIMETQEGGRAAGNKKKREPKDFDAVFNGARYINEKGWDGFHAGSIRNACISACRLVGYKMTIAKLSIFVEADGWDKFEPQIPLIRIKGVAKKQIDPCVVANGNIDLRARAAYYDWSAKLKIRWDADQFTIQDISNLLMRVGMQVGIGEGRPDSKKSAGMGWGLFMLKKTSKTDA